MAKNLTDAQRRALQSARDHGDPTTHLRGRSELGGWTWTRAALIRAGYLTRDGKITQAGRQCLAQH